MLVEPTLANGLAGGCLALLPASPPSLLSLSTAFKLLSSASVQSSGTSKSSGSPSLNSASSRSATKSARSSNAVECMLSLTRQEILNGWQHLDCHTTQHALLIYENESAHPEEVVVAASAAPASPPWFPCRPPAPSEPHNPALGIKNPRQTWRDAASIW